MRGCEGDAEGCGGKGMVWKVGIDGWMDGATLVKVDVEICGMKRRGRGKRGKRRGGRN